MKLCLSCKFVSPGSAFFCGRCQRSFGGPLCRKLHKSPQGSLYCVECGESALTEPTSYVVLGTFSRPVIWLGVLLGVSVVAHHLTAAGAIAWNLADWCLSAVFGLSHHSIVCFAERVAGWLTTLFLMSLFLPQQFGKGMRAAIVRLSVFAMRSGWTAAVLLARCVFRLVEGSVDHGKKTKQKKS